MRKLETSEEHQCNLLETCDVGECSADDEPKEKNQNAAAIQMEK